RSSDLDANAPEVAAQARGRPDVTAGAHEHVSDEHRARVDKGAPGDDRRQAVDRPDTHRSFWGAHPIHTLALRNMRIQGESSPHFSGCHDICTLRNTRSGCGIRIVKR